MENETPAKVPFSYLPVTYQTPAWLKFALLSGGMRITQAASDALFGVNEGNRLKKPIRTRSGVSGGLDLRLSEDIFVNAPVLDPIAITSEFLLDWKDNSFNISRGDKVLGEVEALPEPEFYAHRTHDQSELMVRIAQMCSPDRFCFGMTGPGCSFWSPNERCRYCSIGANAPADASNKREQHLYEVLELALADKNWPARHVLLGGGTPPGPDMGALLAARLCSGIKQRFDVSVYVMIAAPLENKYIDMLYDSGVDELGINLEFWSESAWDLYIPGKRDRVGKTRYLRALEYTATLFGPIRARSILIAGLEPAKETINGVTALAQLGVMPILSPFRPLAGTPLADVRGFNTDTYIDLYEEARQISESFGLPLGPTCVCCQNNTLALPFGQAYRWYGINNASEEKRT